MKNVYFFILFCIGSMQAQIVNIPDANFKAYLLNNPAINTNSDGEIQETEAAAVTDLDVSGLGIASLEGIAPFTNLTQLDCSDNLLTEFEINLPVISGGLNISNNPLESVSIITQALHNFICNNTALTELDLSQVPRFITAFSISDNPNLQHINLKNGSNSACTAWHDGDCLTPVTFVNNPQLQTICVDDVTEATSFEQVLGNPELTYLFYCDFTPGGFYNTVTGTVKLDIQGNGCDASDSPAANMALRMNSLVENLELGTGFADESGNFTLYPPLFLSNYNSTITPVFEHPYFSITPASYTTDFSGPFQQATVDFCIAPNGVHPDLEISIISLTPARPGFDATYKLILKNKGTETQSGLAQLLYDDAVLDFVSATPGLMFASSGTLTWDFDVLEPFESTEMIAVFNVNSPTEIPAVNAGDVLTFTANALDGTDETPSDNTFELLETVVNSYDPNDKSVAQGQFINPSQLDDYLHYTIRFQNLGTFAAQNVVIMDYLSSVYDFSTLQIVGASHPYRATSNGYKLEFIFEGINIPPVSQDEPGSHGFATFKVKPRDILPVGIVIENDAEIYFDFNFPIVTNTVTTTLAALATKEFAQQDFVVYPNPAGNQISIQFSEKSNVKKISIHDVIGQLVKEIPLKMEANTLKADISELSTGTYLIRIDTDKGTSSKKLLKL